jgi:L-lactate dehydrogenase complex protein LldE
MIALHVPCLVQAHRPQLLEAMLRVGERLGLDQSVPQGQTCCGLPAWEAGFEDAARDAAQRTLALFRDAEVVATPSTACLTMFRQHIPELLADTPWAAEAQRLAEKTRSWCSLLAAAAEDDALRARFHFNGRVILLPVCGAEACTVCQTLLTGVEGLTLLHSPVSCCSFSFELHQRAPAIAEGVAETLAAPLTRARADAVLVHEPGCLWRLGPYFQEPGAPRLLHPAEFMAALLR